MLTRPRHFTALSLLILVLKSGCSSSPALSPVEVEATLAGLAKRYNLSIVTHDVQPADRRILAIACTPEELAPYTGLFAQEFGLYPVDVIGRAQLERLVICKDLSYDAQLRGAIPDFESKTLYLDAVRGGSNPTYQRKVIHHDFFHMIDYRDDGNLYADKEWEKLNPAGFHYGTGGANAQGDPMSSVLTDRWPGFLNSYSKTGVEEDKAEMYANLVVEPAYVERRAQTDAVVRAKVAAIKRLMERFSPDADDHFWARAAALR